MWLKMIWYLVYTDTDEYDSSNRARIASSTPAWLSLSRSLLVGPVPRVVVAGDSARSDQSVMMMASRLPLRRITRRMTTLWRGISPGIPVGGVGGMEGVSGFPGVGARREIERVRRLIKLGLSGYCEGIYWNSQTRVDRKYSPKQ